MNIAFIYQMNESIGIEYLSSALKKEGHNTRLFYEPGIFSELGGIRSKFLGKLFNYKEAMIKEIIKSNPDIICFSVISDGYQWSLDIIKKIKKIKNIPILIGGIHPTTNPEETINNKYIDMICIGEGDSAIVELANNFNKRFDIKNIWFKKDNQIIRNPIRPLIKNLDNLPFPDKDLFYDKAPYFKLEYTLITARGCPYECTYCCNSPLKKLYPKKDFVRRRSPQNVIDELLLAKKKYNIKFVRFFDEILISDIDWFKKFSKLYKKQINLPYFCFIHSNYIDDNSVKLLKESGCHATQMGIQSLDKKVREERLHRYTTNEKIYRTIKLLRQNHIFVSVDFILGIPGEKNVVPIEIIDFYLKYKPNYVNYYWLQYYPNTEMTNYAIQNGIISKTDLNRVFINDKETGFIKGGVSYKSTLGKIQTLQVLAYILPKKWIKWLLKKDRYLKLPTLTPYIILFISITFKRYKYNFGYVKYKKRYQYFMLKKIFNRENSLYYNKS